MRLKNLIPDQVLTEGKYSIYSLNDLFGKGQYYFGEIDFTIDDVEKKDRDDNDPPSSEDAYFGSWTDWKFKNDGTIVNVGGKGKMFEISGNLTVNLFAKNATGYLFDKKYIFKEENNSYSGYLPCLVPKNQVNKLEVEKNTNGDWLIQDVKKVVIPVEWFKKGSPSFSVNRSSIKFSLNATALAILKEI